MYASLPRWTCKCHSPRSLNHLTRANTLRSSNSRFFGTRGGNCHDHQVCLLLLAVRENKWSAETYRSV